MNNLKELMCRFQKDVRAYYITKRDINRVGKMVGDTFTDDPAIRFLISSSTAKVYEKYFQTVYRSMLGDAIIISSDSEINNLVVLCPPGYDGIPTLRFLLNGGLDVVLGLGLDGVKRSFAFEKNTVEVRKRFSDENTWYLMTFAVEAGKTHQGLGSAILRPVLEWIDKNRYSLYLETHKAVNIEIYEHYGFQTVDTCMVPGSQIKQYGMIRK